MDVDSIPDVQGEAGEIAIRKATLRDAGVIADFNRAMAWETERKALHPDVITAGVRGLLQHPARGFYLVAEHAREIVGSLMVTMEWSDWRNGVFWWIQSVYVRPEWRRQGIYTRLYDYVRQEAAAEPDVCGFRLYVDRDNTVAQQVYASLGMVATHYLIYEETPGETPNDEADSAPGTHPAG